MGHITPVFVSRRIHVSNHIGKNLLVWPTRRQQVNILVRHWHLFVVHVARQQLDLVKQELAV